ncbi:MAG: S41 family peptidase [Actinomycetota bacterium]|nr:S41 family peptidase [Actinomycetota bacterium]
MTERPGAGHRLGTRPGRTRNRSALSIAIVAALMMMVPACTARPPESPGEVWRSDGYGWIYSLSGDQLQTYEVTEISCLPGQTLDQIGPPSPDGVISFGYKDIPSRTVRKGPSGQATLHLLGTAADVDLVALPGLPSACSRQASNDPHTNFDIFWATFAENYNSFGRKNVNWAAVRDQYRPMLDNDTDPHELFGILRAMIEPLGDNHTSINGPDDQEFTGLRPGTRELSNRTVRTAVDNHLRALGATQLQSFAREKIVYADLPDGRGYLRISAFAGYRQDDRSYVASSAELARTLDTVFTPQRVATLRSLIIDVRLNSGGDDALGLQVAARLTDSPYVAFTKQPRNDPRDPSRHGRPQTVTVTPAAAPRYTGPVSLLISDLTISAGETFVQAMMGRSPAPARIGTTTQGVFSDDMSRRLPNGWTFTLGNEEYVGPDGQNYEGVGIPPTVRTPVFTAEELDQNRDSALDATQ